MAFVATNDQHGNEVMRVVLSTEPGNRTVASCQNVRINCSNFGNRSETHAGRYDHRHRFHYFADAAPRLRRTDLYVLHGQIGHGDGEKEQALGEREQLELKKQQKLEREKKKSKKEKKQEESEQLKAQTEKLEKRPNETLKLQKKTAMDKQPLEMEKSQQESLQAELKNKSLHVKQKEKEKSKQEIFQRDQKEKPQQQAKHRYSKYLEWSYEEISQSQKESQLKQITQPKKVQSERSKSKIKPQVAKCLTERLQPESLHLEGLKEEKLQLLRLKTENSQPEKSHQEDLQPKREKRTQGRRKLQLQVTPQMQVLHSASPQTLKNKSQTEMSAQPDKAAEQKDKPLKALPRDQNRSSQASPHQSHASLSIGELIQWNSAEVIAHSTLLSMQNKLGKRGSSETSSAGSPFYAWLAAKKEKQNQLKEERRLSSELEEQRAKERSRLAQLNYERWIKEKTSQLRRAKSDMSSSSRVTSNSRQSLPAEEAQRRLLEWEREKLSELREQRLKHAASLERQNLIDSARRELSAEAWEQWVHASRNKPKPVPMGKGLDSLRGTIAPLFKNPNEWKSVHGPIGKKQQGQPPQPRPKRQGPDYERLERLAQPRRAVCRPSLDVKAEPLQLDENNPLTKLNNSLDSCMTRPQSTPLIWSKDNAQRVREMKKKLQLSDCQAEKELHGDQLDQLRKQQDQQNSKDLPDKFQVKREKLRLRLKNWLEDGKALPQRSRNSSCLDLKDELKREMKQEIKEQQRRAVFVEEEAEMQRRRAVLNESRALRSNDHLQPMARKPITPLQRARSIEPKHILKTKDLKDTPKVRPWR